MLKLSGLVGVFALAVLAGMPASAAPLGSHVGACRAGTPSLRVEVAGFKQRRGGVRVQTYGGDPQSYFEKGRFIDRIDVAVPAAGPLVLCVPVGRAGAYAVSVRHDIDGNHKTGRSDGGGMSGNPGMSVTDLLFKRKPRAERVAVRVGGGTTTVPVTLNYIQGMSFRPIAPAAER